VFTPTAGRVDPSGNGASSRRAIREVVAYAGVVLCLLRELCCRTPDEFRRTLGERR